MARTPSATDTATVLAARAGDPDAVDRLVADHLPLVYTIVGRALPCRADVDDVVQETMLRTLRGLGELREPAAFRSWLVAITVRQVRTRQAARRSPATVVSPEDVAAPEPDFTDVSVARLELGGQRQEAAEATRWLDADHREVLSLWWLEVAGELGRDEVVDALGVTRPHAAVRVQRMKGQLETARAVVRALAAEPPCTVLQDVTARWDGRPSPLWRKRIARHTRGCARCAPAWSGLLAPEELLRGPALVPVPLLLAATVRHLGDPSAGSWSGAAQVGAHGAGAAAEAGGGGSAGAVKAVVAVGTSAGRRALAAVLLTGAVAGGGLVAVEPFAGGGPGPAAVVAAHAPVPRVVVAPDAPAPQSVAPLTASPPAKTEPAAETPPSTSPKKGVGTWPSFDGTRGALDDVGAGWFYNWSPSDDGTPGPADVEFVPMIWGAESVTDANLALARDEGEVLLGFNEPDLDGQAAMSVEEALDLWPRLEATGMRLGSPAVAVGADVPGGWLDRFMTGARDRGLRVDFVTVHWYGSDFGADAPEHFLSYVDAVHERYGLPVWVTEYGLIDFTGPTYPTGAQAAAFINATTRGMQERPYVERYAWFGLPAVGDSQAYGLYRDASTPTEAGVAYRAAGRGGG
ncbi:sigma-70 family RNA polymerase sigma factor [Thalassiella azotivora]